MNMHSTGLFCGILLSLLWSFQLVQAELSDEAARNDTKAVQLLEKILKSSEPRIRPNVYGPPVEVRCDFYIQSLGPMNEVDMDFNMEIYFRQRWTDLRLSFNEASPIQIPPQYLDKIWLPDVYFPNEMEGNWHEITVPNKAITVFPNGTIRYSARLTLRLACNMLLMNFPLDYQTCHLKISSYSYDASQVNLIWHDDDPVEIHEQELSLPQFELLNTKHGNCEIRFKTGDFSCLMTTFHLKRQIGFYVLQTYIPSILIVMLSWVSFWISKDAVPARISLGVTTVLTMTTQLSTSRSNSMRVSYPKAIDVWYASCMLFVFGALLEYALINVLTRSRARYNGPNVRGMVKGGPGKGKKSDMINSQSHLTGNDIEMQMQNVPDYETLSTSDPNDENEDLGLLKWKLYYRRVRQYFRTVNAKGVDHASRTIFPSAFAVFNLVYWVVYSQPSIFLPEH